MVAWRLQTIGASRSIFARGAKQFASLWRWGLKGREKEGRQMSRSLKTSISVFSPNDKRASLANSRKCAAS